MWRLRRTSTREFVRIGRFAVERWVGQGAGLSLAGREPLPVDVMNQPEGIAQALPSLYADRPVANVTLLLESAWSPVLLADTGGGLWGEGPVTALVRHRLGSLYGSPDDDVSMWDVRVDHRAGDRFALGIGLPLRAKECLVAGAHEAGMQLEAMVPAFQWGWQRQRPARQGQASWWIWPEQDRMLLARVEAGQVVALNSATPLLGANVLVEQVVKAEGVRYGLDAHLERISVAAWSRPTELPPSTQRVSWHSVIGEAPADEQHRLGAAQAVKASA